MIHRSTVFAAAALLAACTTGAAADPRQDTSSPDPGAPPPAAAAAPGPRWETTDATKHAPRDVVELFETRILPTCALNGGVCHNSKNYPDLHNVAALMDAITLTPAMAAAPAKDGWREIAPGHPEKSLVVARLWDTDLDPELMPRQCRAWDDDATRALACWIEKLGVDAQGNVTGFYAPIDLASCTWRPSKPGRCGPGEGGVTRVFEQRCTGCHGGDAPSAGLDLRAAAFHAATVNRPSTERPGSILVVPNDPSASYLFLKVTADPPRIDGARMPKDGTLSADEIETVRAWIAGGAP
jgi:hypothetical protein